jgi:hypothetical protein
MKPMIKTAILTLCVLVALPVKADPVVALASLILAQKITQPKAKPVQRNTTSWRELLQVDEKNALDKIRSHPAISACLKRADQNHPVATYHLRKIAIFSAMVQKEAGNENPKTIAQMNYRWPAKGFQWCKEQAGITTVSNESSLKREARQLANLSIGSPTEMMVAMSD